MAALFGLSIYLWIALISLVFLILLSAFGHYGFEVGHGADMDIGHDFGQFTGAGISPLSPPLMAAFGSTFGFIGALLEAAGLDPILTAFGATVAGAGVAIGLFFTIQRFLVQSQTSSDVDPTALVGRDGTVLIPITPGKPGQILVITDERGRSLFQASAQEAIPRDSLVEILGFTGGVANVRKKLS